jgi:hypothetical protein
VKAVSNNGECVICNNVMCAVAGPREREREREKENGREDTREQGRERVKESGREKERGGASLSISNTQGSELILMGREEGEGEGEGSEGSGSGFGVGCDARDRMWVCPRLGCGSGSHLYCMAVAHIEEQKQSRGGGGGRRGKGGGVEGGGGGEQFMISGTRQRSM